MRQPFEISDEILLVTKMHALEAQFQLPVYNEDDWIRKRRTEIALGEIYMEITRLHQLKSIYYCFY